MDAIANTYESSDDNDDDLSSNTNSQSKPLLLAPNVDTSASTEVSKYHDMSTREILHNPKADILFGPIEGPLRKHSTNREQEFKPKQTTLCGYVDIDNIDGLSFAEQYHTFESFGYAMNPSTNNHDNDKYIGDKLQLKENKAMTIFNQSNQMIKTKKTNIKKRLRNEDPSDIDGYLGPWAPTYKSTEEKEKYESELNKRKEEWTAMESLKKKTKKRKLNDDSDSDGEYDEEKVRLKREEARKYSQSIESTEFHGLDSELYDYQGRTYMHCAAEYRNIKDSKYMIPKKRIAQFIGHKSGVNCIRFLPKTGHLLLSASNDCTCKLWDVYAEDKNKKLLRTFKGHSAGVRNVCFNRTGSRFLTTSYDKWIKLFDTEKGVVLWRGTSGILSFSSKFYPKNENEFLCGQKNKIAVQWDMRHNKIVQKYEEHLSCVNDVLFIDNNRRFVTTSDDKKIFIWDYGTPVVIKHISEPHLHSVPFLTLHPNKKWFCGQSLNNTVITYSAANKIGRLNQKKLFTGHLCAGYAIQIDISSDGNYIVSGDANGYLYFWDWRNTKLLHKILAHKKVTMGAVWHPVNRSMLATCSWDATIALWQ